MWKSISLALIGAILGGWLGYHGFFWAYQQGFYAMILPGALIGFGASLGRCRHPVVPIVCATGALALGLFTEWRARPFVADGSWSYFVAHLSQLKAMTWIMISLGGVLAFWLPFGNRRTTLSP